MSSVGGIGNDIISGGSASDTISGGNGNDTLNGYAGADIISGGAGNDIITGGAGADTLTGGDGTDTFIFTSSDLEEDPGSSIDAIKDLSSGEKIGIDNDLSWKKINITDNTATPTLDNSTKDAYIQKIGGKYLLVIEKAADGSSKGYVDLGTDKPGEPGKWSQETINGINYLSIIENAAPTLKITDTTAQVRETNFSKWSSY